MSSPISLDSFYLKRLSLEWQEGCDNFPAVSRLAFSFDLKTNKDDDNKLLVTIALKGRPDSNQEGLLMEVEICGFFTCLDKSKDKFFCLVNAANILYGILRGQISMMTSSFPSGPVALPTVMMKDKIIEFIEMENKKKTSSDQTKTQTTEKS